MKVLSTNGREIKFPAGNQLISTTDIKGRITYANKAFCEVSGFTQEELIGKPHNVVRHPDMPPAAFENLWHSLKNDKPWRGIVKNRCKDGSHYWVDAYVTPIYDDGQKTGYQSVRVVPEPEQVARAEQLYPRLMKESPARVLKRRTLNPLWLASAVLLLLNVIGLVALGAPIVVTALSLITELGLIALLLLLTGKLTKLSRASQELFDNPLIQKVYCNDMSDFGRIALALSMGEARVRTILGRLSDMSRTLNSAVDTTDETIQQSKSQIDMQTRETELVASAVSQLASATQEIATNTGATSQEAQQAQEMSQQGEVILSDVVGSVSDLMARMQRASTTAAELEQNALKIDAVITVINQIAEQTNLLALNAAIEAARAGEQGRGFSVVSDEVRTLATRTQQSTEEIRQTVDLVQTSVRDTVKLMHESQEQTEEIEQQVRRSGETFADLITTLADVTDRCVQIASATEEQSAVVNEVQQNIVTLNDQASSIHDTAGQTAEACGKLRKMATSLDSMVKAFAT